MRKLLLWALQLDLALWFGASTYFALMAAEELLGGLPIDTAGRVIGILFPPFFTLCAITSVLGWVLYAAVGSGLHATARSWRFGHVVALIGALSTLVNLFVMLPVVEHVERLMGPISQASAAMLARFGFVHGISLLILFLSLVSVVLLWTCLSLNLRLKEEV